MLDSVTNCAKDFDLFYILVNLHKHQGLPVNLQAKLALVNEVERLAVVTYYENAFVSQVRLPNQVKGSLGIQEHHISLVWLVHDHKLKLFAVLLLK